MADKTGLTVSPPSAVFANAAPGTVSTLTIRIKASSDPIADYSSRETMIPLACYSTPPRSLLSGTG